MGKLVFALFVHFLAIFSALSFVDARSRATVMELNSKFLEPAIRNDGMWLIKFYAPWCGHCKSLAPIYEQVGETLYHSDIRVAKVDATKYTDVARAFSVGGFPTVLFVKGEDVYNFHGARTKNELVDFAYRAMGPALRKINDRDGFDEARDKHVDGHFFLYVGLEEGPLWDIYSEIAKQRMSQSYFYYISSDKLPKSVPTPAIPTILVFKDENYYWYPATEGELSKASVEEWILKERLLVFPEVLSGNFHEFLHSKKNLAILVIKKTLTDQIYKDHKKVFKKIKDLAFEYRRHSSDQYQFAWVDGGELVNSVVMHFVPVPGLIILNATTYQYYEPRGNISEMSDSAIQAFLAEVADGSIAGKGGNWWYHKISRMFFEIYSTLYKMFTNQPLVTCILLGLPTMILSFICYNICCAEVYDDEERQRREEIHQKVE